MSEQTVTVYAIAAVDPSGHVVELAKFFDPAHAQAHIEKVRHARNWRDVGIVIRNEPVREQHPAHWEHIGYKPKGA